MSASAPDHYRPPDKDTFLQQELWSSALLLNIQSPACKPQARKVPLVERTSVAAAVGACGSALRAFEPEQALHRHHESARKSVSSSIQEAAVPHKVTLLHEAVRPPCGSGYQYPSCTWPQATLAEHFGRMPGPMQVKSVVSDGLEIDFGSRRDRIEALQRDMLKHDEDKLLRLGKGTAPLRDPDGALPLPVPPLDVPPRLQKQRASEASGATRGGAEGPRSARDILAHERILGLEAKASNSYPCCMQAGNADVKYGQAEQASAARADIRQMSALQGYKDLLIEAELTDPSSKAPEYWSFLALQLCTHAYEASQQDVLRMVRAVAAAAHAAKLARTKQELLQAAEHLLGLLSARLCGVDLDLLTDVAEAMCDAQVGSQIYLDALMAHTLAQLHCDCQALTMKRASRLAGTLSRLARTMRLRPRGTGGPSTSTNLRVMEILEKRLVERAPDATAEVIASLDGYYLVRLCSLETRKAILTKVAELEFGFRASSSQYLPLALELQAILQRELGESFRWSLPPSSRGYFGRLQDASAGKNTPWALGDPHTTPTTAASASRSLLEELRAKYSHVP